MIFEKEGEGSAFTERTFSVSSDGSRYDAAGGKSVSSSVGRWRTTLQSVFLPEGFPNSVTPDYLEFQIWLDVVCSSSSSFGWFGGLTGWLFD